jgi:hypothetical protein
MNCADFYGFMGTTVNDNSGSILPGNSINFPNPIINPYGTIQRVLNSPNQFILPANSFLDVFFEVVIQNTGELVVVLNGTELNYTVVGKSGNGPVIGMCIISTPTGSPSVLSINNPTSAVSGGLKVDSASGALTLPLTCHLIIKQCG